MSKNLTGTHVVLDKPNSANDSDAEVISRYNLANEQGLCVGDMGSSIRVKFVDITLDLAKGLFSPVEAKE